jgi:hypothetical protein
MGLGFVGICISDGLLSFWLVGNPMGGIVVIWTDVIFCNRTVYISI